MLRAADNPLSTDRLLKVRFRPLTVSWEELLKRLEGLDYRAAIVGPEGSGKTTLLEDLASSLKYCGFETVLFRVSEEDRAVHWSGKVNREAVYFVDSADLLGPLEWLSLKVKTNRARGLIITAQEEGRLPTLLHCKTSPELLYEILRELLGEKASSLKPTVEHVFAKHNGNLRTALLNYYDQLAGR